MKLLKLVPDDTNFRFLRWRKIAMTWPGIFLGRQVKSSLKKPDPRCFCGFVGGTGEYAKCDH